ncbi:MAG TPA: AI-2E family transporter [Anaerolineales bacterium]|nr:AI-2E family transporter [Anaerolineales bacterium]
MNPNRPRWPAQTKLVVSLLVLALVIYLLFRFSAVIPPLILAIILAFILSPGVRRLQVALRLPRGLAALLAYLLLVVIAVTVPVVLVPTLAAQMKVLNLDLQHLFEQTESLLANQYNLFGIRVNASQLLEQLSTAFRGLAQSFIGQTLVFLVDVLTSAVWVIFILVVSFYLIKDGPALRNMFETLPPPDYRQDYIRLRDEINLIWGSFFRGQLILAFVVAIMFTVMGFILGLPFALAMGILAGLMEFLPSIGHGIWLTIASILALLLGSTWLPLPNWAFFLLLVGLHTAFTQFDLNYLIPRIIGQSLQLPPLVVILGIVAGAVTAGIMGIPLAAPVIASARVLGRYIFANLLDLDPFPPRQAPPPPRLPGWWRAWRKARERQPSR